MTEKMDENPQRKKPGRKPTVWSEREIQKAEDYVSLGWLSMNELATAMGIAKSTMFEMFKRQPEIERRLNRARIEQKALMVTKMTGLALDGNVQALRWKLSVCHGLSEKTRVMVETKDPIAAKVMNMSREEMEKRAAEIVAKGKGEKRG